MHINNTNEQRNYSKNNNSKEKQQLDTTHQQETLLGPYGTQEQADPTTSG